MEESKILVLKEKEFGGRGSEGEEGGGGGAGGSCEIDPKLVASLL